MMVGLRGCWVDQRFVARFVGWGIDLQILNNYSNPMVRYHVLVSPQRMGSDQPYLLGMDPGLPEQSCQSVVIKTHQDISTKGSMFCLHVHALALFSILLSDALYFCMVCIQYDLRRNKLWQSVISSEKQVCIQASSSEHIASE